MYSLPIRKSEVYSVVDIDELQELYFKRIQAVENGLRERVYHPSKASKKRFAIAIFNLFNVKRVRVFKDNSCRSRYLYSIEEAPNG